MRVAGRGEDGKAKAIKTDNSGILEVKDTITRQLFPKRTFAGKEVYETAVRDAKGFQYTTLRYRMLNGHELHIQYYYLNWQDEYVKMGESEKIYGVGLSNGLHNIEVKLKTNFYSIKFTNTDQTETLFNTDNYETLSNLPILEREQEQWFEEPIEVRESVTRQIFKKRSLVGKETVETPILNGEGFQYSTIRLPMVNGFRMYVQFYKLNWEDQYIPIGDQELIYTGLLTPNIHKFQFELKTNHYKLTFENTDTTGTYFNKDNYETLTNVRFVEETEQEPSNTEVIETKKPKGTLVFERTFINSKTFCKGYDGKFYVVDINGNLKKYDKLTISASPAETGINIWDSIGETGNLSYLFYMPEGFTFFATFEGVTRIYHAKDMNATPELVYQSTNTEEVSWSPYFGIKSYYNGLDSIILASTYGFGQEKRDLVLSVDGGQSFKVVKKTKSADTSGTKNSHWHDVAIDPYHGLLWATEGDGVINHDIYYSYDLGETWRTLPNKNNTQPTGIAVFPDRVVFGRDADYAGVDYILKPNTLSEGFKSPEVLRELKDSYAAYYYAKAPIVNGNEAYMSFFLYNDSTVPMIIGSGDYGASWHGLYFGNTNIGNFYADDDEYIYAIDRYFTNILRAKKPNWI